MTIILTNLNITHSVCRKSSDSRPGRFSMWVEDSPEKWNSHNFSLFFFSLPIFTHTLRHLYPHSSYNSCDNETTSWIRLICLKCRTKSSSQPQTRPQLTHICHEWNQQIAASHATRKIYSIYTENHSTDGRGVRILASVGWKSAVRASSSHIVVWSDIIKIIFYREGVQGNLNPNQSTPHRSARKDYKLLSQHKTASSHELVPFFFGDSGGF